MTRFKIPVRVLQYLLIGFILSLLHTWYIVNYENKYSSGWLKFFSQPYLQTDQSTTGWIIGERNEDGDHWDIIGVRNSDHRVYQIRHEINTRGYSGVEREFKPGSIPSWTRVSPVPTKEDARSKIGIIEQFNGWPFLAWRGEACLGEMGIQYHGSIPAHEAALGRAGWSTVVLFPYEPVFPGVLYNAAIFGSGLFFIVFVFKHYRRRFIRWLRLSQLKCPNCKYNIRGLATCPECGEKIDPAKLPAHLHQAQAPPLGDASRDP